MKQDDRYASAVPAITDERRAPGHDHHRLIPDLRTCLHRGASRLHAEPAAQVARTQRGPALDGTVPKAQVHPLASEAAAFAWLASVSQVEHQTPGMECDEGGLAGAAWPPGGGRPSASNSVGQARADSSRAARAIRNREPTMVTVRGGSGGFCPGRARERRKGHAARWAGSESQARRRLPDLR